MKLIEKKCPNCGAKLSFESTDKEVTCKYCDQSYEIEREINLKDILGDEFDPREFALRNIKTITKTGKFITIFSICMFIFIFIMFFIIFFRSFPRIMG